METPDSGITDRRHGDKQQRRTRARPEPLTISVPEAGRRFYGLSKNASYRAATRGEIPTIKVGGLLRVPVAAMHRKLEACGA